MGEPNEGKRRKDPSITYFQITCCRQVWRMDQTQLIGVTVFVLPHRFIPCVDFISWPWFIPGMHIKISDIVVIIWLYIKLF